MKRFALIAVSVLVLAVAAAVWAAPQASLSERFGRPGLSVSRGQRLGPRQAERIALNRYGGRLYSGARLTRYAGRWCYNVVLKSNGRLRTVIIGANSGRVESTWVSGAGKYSKKKWAYGKPRRKRW